MYLNYEYPHLSSNLIDTDAPPRIVKELGDAYQRDIQHEGCGLLMFDPVRLLPYRTAIQLRGGYQGGTGLRYILTRLRRQRLNANVLDHQLTHQYMFGEHCRPFRLFYWGTRFFSQKGWELVRYAEWNPQSDRWESDCMCADGEFGPNDAVALYGDPL